MRSYDEILKSDEAITLSLRELYHRYGYAQYKMSKFEEYDLYAKNKDFLISDNIITFTDTNGKLMALKPDVTLSIVRNSRQNTQSVQKVYYNENVYRISERSHAFREIMQVGLECIGDVDAYYRIEVMLLAAESLRRISPACKLDISHLDILSEAVDRLGLNEGDYNEVLRCIGQKNMHELTQICTLAGVEQSKLDVLKALIGTYGTPAAVLPKLREMGCNGEAVEELERVCHAMTTSGLGDMVSIDFSIVSDMRYYNGLVCKGFVNGVPTSVLSGGQYDKLMQKMGSKSKAIGFAVYLDALERLSARKNDYDVDTVLLYDASTDVNVLCQTVKLLTQGGTQVMAQKSVPEKLRYKQLVRLNGNGVEILENNA